MTNYRNLQIALTVALVAGLGVCLLTIADIWQGLFILINLVAYYLYGLDKYRATHSRRHRISERVLLGIAVAGGVAGSVLGQLTFRHKVRKQPFRRVFWGIAIVQAMILTYIYLRS